MEKKLRELFDYQRFIQNKKLNKILETPEPLPESELSMLSAAGEKTPSEEKPGRGLRHF